MHPRSPPKGSTTPGVHQTRTRPAHALLAFRTLHRAAACFLTAHYLHPALSVSHLQFNRAARPTHHQSSSVRRAALLSCSGRRTELGAGYEYLSQVLWWCACVDTRTDRDQLDFFYLTADTLFAGSPWSTHSCSSFVSVQEQRDRPDRLGGFLVSSG